MRLYVCLLLPWLCAAQTPFRVDVQLINVGFSVRDAQGRLVPDLTRNDIEVYDDGAPQKVAFFARSVDVPLNLGLVVDLSGSQGSFVKQHHRDLDAFLRAALTARDRAFLLCFGNAPRLVVDFTSSAKFLVDALDGYLDVHDKGVYPMLGPPEIRTAGTAFYDAIYHSTTSMLAKVEGGRKALIIFSDGEDNASAHHMMDVIEAAQTNNVLLFPIRYTEVRGGRLTARNKYGASMMARIALETGGSDFDAGAKGLAEGFRLIGEQLRTSYELAYHSPNPDPDGAFHKIRIVVRQPGLQVRAKSGYYAR